MSFEKLYETLQQVLANQNALSQRIDRIENIQGDILNILKGNPVPTVSSNKEAISAPILSSNKESTPARIVLSKKGSTPALKDSSNEKQEPSVSSVNQQSEPTRNASIKPKKTPTAKPKPLPAEDNMTPRSRHRPPQFHSTPSSSADLSAAFPEFPSPLPLLSDQNISVADLGQIYSFHDTGNEVNNEQYDESVGITSFHDAPNHTPIRYPKMEGDTSIHQPIQNPLMSRPVTFRKTFKCAVKSPNISTIPESPEYSSSKNSQYDSGSSENNNENLPGRRQRRAATAKVASYKEPSLIKKMRRNF